MSKRAEKIRYVNNKVNNLIIFLNQKVLVDNLVYRVYLLAFYNSIIYKFWWYQRYHFTLPYIRKLFQ